MQSSTHIPFVRIEKAMAPRAIARGTRIAVLGTFPAVHGPTQRLIAEKADACGKAAEMMSNLADDAFRKQVAGARNVHDAHLADPTSRLTGSADVIRLAKTSIARVVPRSSSDFRARVVGNPRLGLFVARATLERSVTIMENLL